MAISVGGTTKSFDTPEDHRTVGGVEIDIVNIGDMKVKRATYPVGWRFSKHMGASTCLDTHIGYTLSGHMTVLLDDETQLAFGPGDVFVIPAGHDAWVTGGEPRTIVQFDEGESAARRFNVVETTVKAA